MEEKRFFVKDEEGIEREFEIVLTFEAPESKINYVVYKEPGDGDEVMAAIYDETAKGEGKLLEIETEEEFEMIQNVLDAFMDEEEE